MQKQIQAAETALKNKEAKQEEQAAAVAAAEEELPVAEAQVPELQQGLTAAEEGLDAFRRSIQDEVWRVCLGCQLFKMSLQCCG